MLLRLGPRKGRAHRGQVRPRAHVLGIVQAGKLPDETLVCPASNKPFLVVKTKTDVIIRSPNPELYGFKDLRVSKNRPVPEIIK